MSRSLQKLSDLRLPKTRYNLTQNMGSRVYWLYVIGAHHEYTLEEAEMLIFWKETLFLLRSSQIELFSLSGKVLLR